MFGIYRTSRTNPLAGSTSVSAKTGKRVKQVYGTGEIAHLWAYKAQDSARNSQGNFYFDGAVIYSYGSHYPLATHCTGTKKQAGILINTSTRNRGGSVTTNSQRSDVRHAVRHISNVFEVVSLELSRSGHDDNLVAYRDEAKEQLSKARNGRKYACSALQNAFAAQATARKYAAFFGLSKPTFEFLPKGEDLDALKTQIAVRVSKAKAADAMRDAKEQARRDERARVAALALPEKIAAWRGGAYVDGYTLRTCPTMLRLRGEEVETSLGARVPVAHAARALKFVQACVNSQREYIRNGHTEHIGHYTIDRIEADGTLHAGCHVIKFDEIQALAPFLK